MASLLYILTISLGVMLQTTILSRVTLLQGPADLVLLILVSWILQDRGQFPWLLPLVPGLLIAIYSALPFWLPLVSYGIVTLITLAIRRRVWQVQILALFTAVFLGTLVTNSIAVLVINAQGIPINILEAVNLVLLPSIILNLILAIPVQAIVKEITRLVTPVEVEV